jgi:hypothetical protein
MMKGLQFTKLATVLGKRIRCNDTDEVYDDSDKDDVVTHRANTAIYNTPSAVIYEGSNLLADVQAVVLHNDVLMYKVGVKRNFKFLHPNASLDLL